MLSADLEGWPPEPPPPVALGLANVVPISPTDQLGAFVSDGPSGREAGEALPTVPIWTGTTLQSIGPALPPDPLPPEFGWLIEKLEGREAVDNDDATCLTETTGPHDQFETAQTLPALDRMQVVGQLRPEDYFDLYRIRLADWADSLHLAIHVRSSDLTPGERIVLLDEQGKLLDDQPFDLSSGSLELMLHATFPLTGQSVVVGIYRPSPATTDAFGNPLDQAAPGGQDGSGQNLDGSGLSSWTGADYSIQITQMSSGFSAGPMPGPTSPSGAYAPESAGPATPAAPSATQEAKPVSLSVGSDTSERVLAVQGPVSERSSRPGRPAPLRSAAPSGGRLAVGPPTRVVDRREAATLDLALIPPGRRPKVEAPEVPAGSLQIPLVEPRRAPGGLTLLAPTLPGRGPGHLAEQTSRARARMTEAEDVTVPGVEVAEWRLGGSSEASGWSRLRVDPGQLVRVGLALAYTATFTLLLPDLAASLRRSHARPRRRLRLASLRRLFHLDRRTCAEPLRITPQPR